MSESTPPAASNGAGTTESLAPTAPVALNLDSLKREGEIPAPFEFVHDARTYTLLDPQEIDWQDLLMGLRNPALFLRFALPREQQDPFLRAKLPAWKMNSLMKAYSEHYNLPGLSELAGLIN